MILTGCQMIATGCQMVSPRCQMALTICQMMLIQLEDSGHMPDAYRRYARYHVQNAR